jgi:hypothetical protein
MRFFIQKKIPGTVGLAIRYLKFFTLETVLVLEISSL